MSAPAPNGATTTAAPAANDARDPSGFLSEIIGAPVTVKLNSGVVYKGELQSVDGYMNIALEGTREFVDGKMRRSYGDAFVRGNNVTLRNNGLSYANTLAHGRHIRYSDWRFVDFTERVVTQIAFTSEREEQEYPKERTSPPSKGRRVSSHGFNNLE
ncbi:hypothetical protein Q7P36_009466 [Cladosporium allicinum]